MAFSPVLLISMSEGGTEIKQAATLSVDSITKLDVSIPDLQTDYAVAFALDISQLEAIVILADGALTFTTRSSVPADVDEFTLAANEPIVWRADNGAFAIGDLFTGDIASLHCDNASGAAVNLKVWAALNDATP